jgi:hypothetical protein
MTDKRIIKNPEQVINVTEGGLVKIVTAFGLNINIFNDSIEIERSGDYTGLEVVAIDHSYMSAPRDAVYEVKFYHPFKENGKDGKKSLPGGVYVSSAYAEAHGFAESGRANLPRLDFKEQ